MKRSLALGIKVGLSALLIALLVRSIDFARLRTLVLDLAPATMFGAAALLAAQGVIMGWRWHRIVRVLGGDLPTGRSIRWVFVGLFFNQALPTSVGGDVMRVYYLRREGADSGLALGSVAIERGTGVVLMGILTTLCLPAVWSSIGDPRLRLTLLAVGPVLLAALVAIGVSDRLLPNRWREKTLAALVALGVGLRKIASHPLLLAEVCALGAASTLAGVLAACLIGRNLGIDLPFAAFVTLVGAAMLLSVLPISLGGWGVREAAIVGLFGAVGVAPERALALSLLWGGLLLLVSLPGGLLWWWGSGQRSGDATLNRSEVPIGPSSRTMGRAGK